VINQARQHSTKTGQLQILALEVGGLRRGQGSSLTSFNG
jgi:hypothetical protein